MWDICGERLTAGRDKSGGLIYLNYKGVVDITPALAAILGGNPDAESTPFGNSCGSAP